MKDNMEFQKSIQQTKESQGGEIMSFVNNKEILKDFYKLSKDEFLKSYDHVTEQEYNMFVISKMKKDITNIKKRILLGYDVMAKNIKYFPDNSSKKIAITKNCFVYLAEQYKIKIPKRVKKYMSRNLVFYIPRKNTYSFINRRNEENINLNPYLEKIREKVFEEHKRKVKNKHRNIER